MKCATDKARVSECILEKRGNRIILRCTAFIGKAVHRDEFRGNAMRLPPE
jgi:hypothetical protein